MDAGKPGLCEWLNYSGVNFVEKTVMEKYIPNNCDFYDELEALATIGKRVRMVYLDQSARVEVQGIIRNLYTRESVEYMTLDTGVTFRLDKLVEIDGKLPPNVC